MPCHAPDPDAGFVGEVGDEMALRERVPVETAGGFEEPATAVERRRGGDDEEEGSIGAEEEDDAAAAEEDIVCV